MFSGQLKNIKSKVLRPKVAIVAAGVLTIAAGGWFVVRTQGAMAASVANSGSVQVTKPVRVEFNQEIAAGYKAEISPSVKGHWEEDRTLFGVDATAFKPDSRFEAGRTYTLRITGMKRLATGAPIPDIEKTFTAQTAPEVKSFAPAANATSIPAKPQLTVVLVEPNNGVRALKPALVPEAPLRLVSSDDQKFTWEPVGPLKQGVAYTFTLDDDHMSADKKRLLSIPFTTVTQPVIKSARTGGHFSPGQKVEIVFDQPMDSSKDGFGFNFKGNGGWANDHTYQFMPEGVQPGKTYDYVVKAGTKSKAGGVIEGDRRYEFATNGAVTAALSPGGTVAVNTPIRVTFDQSVDHASAQSRFSITPAVNGSFSWSGNTMIYNHSGLAYQAGYRYGVAAGVVPVWGLPSGSVLGASFSTQSQIVKLGVPVYKQTYGRSCELSSLRMLLAYRGIKVSDHDILGRVGYSPRARDTGSNSWENPNQMFVGFVDTFSWSQGYGVHAGPVATAARSYGRNATAFFGVSAQFLSQNIHDGNPVEFWGHIGPPRADAWNTTSGVVQTTTSMHGRVIYGVDGSPSNPKGFYINDPWTGSQFYWTTAQVMANMNAVPGVSNQAVVVY